MQRHTTLYVQTEFNVLIFLLLPSKYIAGETGNNHTIEVFHWLIDCCFTPTLAIFHLYRGVKGYKM